MAADLLTRLERAIEQIFEGLFAHSFRGRIQPLEIARRLTRAIEDHKLVSVSQVFAPNEFSVTLNPEDYRTIAPFENAILPELLRHVEETAAELKYGLLGRVQILFEEDPGMERGAMRIESRFVRKEDQGQKVVDAPTTALRPGQAPVIPTSRHALLQVAEGPDTGEEFALTTVVTSIGRGGTNDVGLTDSSVSREHAQIELQEDGFHLRDLGSKNGTFVNGIPATDVLLADGDVVAVGATVFHFRSARVV